MNPCSRLAVNDEGFAFDPGTGDSYLLNPSALFMLQAHRDDEQEVAKRVAEHYGISRLEAEAALLEQADGNNAAAAALFQELLMLDNENVLAREQLGRLED